MIAANRQLQEQHEVSLRDNFEVTEFLRREILTKDGKITLLQSKMEEVIAQHSHQSDTCIANQHVCSMLHHSLFSCMHGPTDNLTDLYIV